MKKIYGKNEHNRTHTSASMYTKNMNAMWHPNDVIRPVI